MPTYQYKREDGSTFEIIQKISDEALKTCPETGQRVKRVITGGGGVVYKGSGWYVTDYKNKSNGSNAAASESNTGKTAAKNNRNESTNGRSASSADSGTSSADSGKTDSKSSDTNN